MGRFIDERGRIFGKVNIVDILVILVIVAVVVFAVVRFTGTSSASVPLEGYLHRGGCPPGNGRRHTGHGGP